MLLKKRKYQIVQGIRKTGFLLALVLFSAILHAQVEEDYSDTTAVLEDYEPEPIQEVPIQEETYQSTTRTDYFLLKWMTATNFDSVKMRHLPDSNIASLRTDDNFWYANHVFEKPAEKKKKKESNWLQTLLWVLTIAGFITFLVIYLMNSNVGLFRSTRSIKGKEDDDDAPEMDNIFAINYQKEIDKAINAGNYRLAVRLMFLRLLRQLSDKNVIQYKQDRTNFDYLMQLSNTAWYKPFFNLARSYEYVWYGKFDIDKNQFDNIKKGFTEIEGQL